jgi:hypothetical protein
MTTRSSAENLNLSLSAAAETGGMTERLLQFIWQFQYFNQSELQSTSGEAIQIISPELITQIKAPISPMQKLKLVKQPGLGMLSCIYFLPIGKNIIIIMTGIMTMSFFM